MQRHKIYPYLFGMKQWIILAVLFLLAGKLSAQAPIPYGNNPRAGRYESVRGIRIYTETYGKGKPLVLLHGNGGSMASMAPLIPYFSKHYQVIAVDSRAHGKSIDMADSLSFEQMADDVSALMQKRNIDSAYIIGWSDGGIIAIDFALRHPEQLIAFAATGANLWPDSTALEPGLWKEMEKEYLAKKDQPKPKASEKASWKYFLLDWWHPHISLASLSAIHKPALIISGDRDLIRLEHTVQIFQSIPNARLWVLPHSSHGTLVEHTADFCRTVDRFFKQQL
jgi:pimeloyl-ACP methyl ester carboxylesterase